MEWQMGPTSYTYNDFGALSTVTDAASNQYRITYTLAGQVDSLLLGTGVSEKREYDDDGRLKFRNRMSSGTLGLLVRDSIRR
jgi:YD repeat-containing protein